MKADYNCTWRFYAKYLVDDDGSKTLLCKILAEEENKNDKLGSNDKKYTECLGISSSYKKNIWNAVDKIEQMNNDNIKEMLKMVS